MEKFCLRSLALFDEMSLQFKTKQSKSVLKINIKTKKVGRIRLGKINHQEMKTRWLIPLRNAKTC